MQTPTKMNKVVIHNNGMKYERDEPNKSIVNFFFFI